MSLKLPNACDLRIVEGGEETSALLFTGDSGHHSFWALKCFSGHLISKTPEVLGLLHGLVCSVFGLFLWLSRPVWLLWAVWLLCGLFGFCQFWLLALVALFFYILS